MTTIYLAGRYSRREELRGYAERLAAAGVGHVRARWLTEDHEWDGREDQLVLARRLATDDLSDLTAADLVIVFTEAPAPGGRNRGGRHVEYGIALQAWLRGRKRLYIVGPPENVFHSLAVRYEVFADLLAALMAERPPRVDRLHAPAWVHANGDGSPYRPAGYCVGCAGMTPWPCDAEQMRRVAYPDVTLLVAGGKVVGAAADTLDGAAALIDAQLGLAAVEQGS